MARKGWDALSPAYKQRLERAGLTQRAYESGGSIQKARGHAQTPERPKDSAKFPKYHTERLKLNKSIAWRKQDLFGTSPKWNPGRALAAMNKKTPPMKKLRYWATINTREDWLDAISEDPSAADFLGYH
jgi:hypothetical protein